MATPMPSRFEYDDIDDECEVDDERAQTNPLPAVHHLRDASYSHCSKLQVDVTFTRHALKRARKRFRLSSDDSARRFIIRQLEASSRHSVQRDGTMLINGPIATVVTRPQQDTPFSIMVVTCYPIDRPTFRQPPRRDNQVHRKSRAAHRAAMRQLLDAPDESFHGTYWPYLPDGTRRD